jgi:transposase-like protein
MSTSDVYHIQGAKGWTVIRTHYGAVGTTFDLMPQERLIRCPECQSHNVERHGFVPRILRGIPACSREHIFFNVSIPRVLCRNCGCSGQIDTGISDPKKSYTLGFAKEVIRLATEMSLSSVADYFGVSWGTVNSILEEYLTRKVGKPQLKKA